MTDEFSDYGRSPRFQSGWWILSGIAVVVLVFALLANAARAQEASPTLQALSQRLMSEINSNLQCSTNLIELQAKLTHAVADVDRLTAKYEPTKKQEQIPIPKEAPKK